jgi:Ca2+-binding RTX toxin-like protein
MATVYGDWLNNTLDANDGVTMGNDTLYGYAGSDTLFGWGGDDVLWGGTGALSGGDGRRNTGDDAGDHLSGGGYPQGDLLDGGSGSDTAVYLDSSAGVVVDLGLGRGLYGSADYDDLISIENLIGSVFGDLLVGSGGGNVLTGDIGDDSLFGEGGNDTLIGGLGGDELVGGSGNDTASYAGAVFGVAASLVSGGTTGEALGDTFETVENLIGSFFADTLTGDANVNVLDGGSGNDTLQGGGAGDELIGGGGTDTAAYGDSASGVTVNLISGLGLDGTAEGDTLTDIENVTGSSHADAFTGDANVNRLSGASGDDMLKGGGGADTLEGGAGLDTVRYGDSDVGVTVALLTGLGSGGTAEGDTLIDVENLIGSTYDDTLTGDEADNELSGANGDDWLEGGGGADVLDGGFGNDTATYLNYGSGVTVSLLTGTGSGSAAEGDILTGIENLYGTVCADTLIGDDGANILHGDGGDDTLRGGGGADRLIGAAGTDTASYVNSTVGVTVNLTAGTGSGGAAEGDTLSGIENVTGSAHDDVLVGNAEANTLLGGGGDDSLRGGAGADTLDGGNGSDTATYIESATGVDVNLLAGTGSGGTAQGDTLSDVENLIGSLFDDDLTGDDGRNLLQGGIGVDELAGHGGNDTLEGGIGDDWLVGGTGADTLAGGSGFDFASYGDSTAGVTIDLTAGTASGGEAAGDTLSSIEHLAGSDYADALTGDAGDNILKGFGGADTLVGGLGADIMVGWSDDDTYMVDNALDEVFENDGDGSDIVLTSMSYVLAAGADIEVFRTTDDAGTAAIDLTGSAFDNEITGNDGANVITGGGGADHLIGRNGDDTYVVDNMADSITEAGGQGIDTVRTSGSYVLTAGADVETLETIDDNGVGTIDLTGNANGNIVRGNNGTNVIAGGNGNDTLTGLGGADSFLFDTAPDAAVNLDVVTDFNVADDTILLADAIFSSLPSVISPDEFVIGTAALDANDFLIYNDATGALFYDSDGVGGTAAIQFAALTPGLALTSLDFVVMV